MRAASSLRDGEVGRKVRAGFRMRGLRLRFRVRFWGKMRVMARVRVRVRVGVVTWVIVNKN
jgi:hypothetical protein